MKKIILVLFALSSISSFAGEIVNKRTGERIYSKCEKYLHASPRCERYSILLDKDGSDVLIAKYIRRTLNNPDDQFSLRENIKEFVATPALDAMFDYFDSAGTEGALKAAMGTAFVGGFTIALVQSAAISATTGLFIVTGSAVLIPVTASAYDLVTMPVRKVYKNIQLRKADKKEFEALNMLSILIESNQNYAHELSNREFKSLIQTLSSIKNK